MEVVEVRLRLSAAQRCVAWRAEALQHERRRTSYFCPSS
jgi:hypothetical protein